MVDLRLEAFARGAALQLAVPTTSSGAVPKDLPPRPTVYDYFYCWSWGGHAHSYPRCALREVSRGRLRASPTAAIIDSQSVKSAEEGATSISARLRCRQEDQGKKRHVLVDTQGLLMHAILHSADVHKTAR